MITNTRFTVLLPLAFVLILGGCGSGAKNLPDEFKVLTKAPLVVPPEYNILPPRPGEVGPQDLRSAERARQAMTGRIRSKNANTSPGEQALVANAARVSVPDPSIRAKLDIETGQLTTKKKSFADRILFWRGSDNYIADETVLDADAEAERLRRQELIKSSTGGKKIVMRKKSRIRLPGL